MWYRDCRAVGVSVSHAVFGDDGVKLADWQQLVPPFAGRLPLSTRTIHGRFRYSSVLKNRFFLLMPLSLFFYSIEKWSSSNTNTVLLYSKKNGLDFWLWLALRHLCCLPECLIQHCYLYILIMFMLHHTSLRWLQDVKPVTPVVTTQATFNGDSSILKQSVICSEDGAAGCNVQSCQVNKSWCGRWW